MDASNRLFDAQYAAFQAGKRAKKRGNAQRWLKAHPAPQVAVEDLLREAYELGQRANASVSV
jgi:hypothetical protein